MLILLVNKLTLRRIAINFPVSSLLLPNVKWSQKLNFVSRSSVSDLPKSVKNAVLPHMSPVTNLTSHIHSRRPHPPPFPPPPILTPPLCKVGCFTKTDQDYLSKNKIPTKAQAAAGATPLRCISIDSPNPHIQLYHHNFLTNDAIVMFF